MGILLINTSKNKWGEFMKIDLSISNKVKGIYNQFSNAPIYEMVQNMVDKNIDAQMLHQLKLMDIKQHKNIHVKSYAEKVYSAYERICRVLVTYPSIEFKNNELKLIDKKEDEFCYQYFGDLRSCSKSRVLNIISIANIGLKSIFAHNLEVESLVTSVIEDDSDIKYLATFLLEVCGEDYTKDITHKIKSNNK